MTDAQKMMNARKRYITIEISEDELRGLGFLADSFSEHLKEGLGTGDAQDDRRGRLACIWLDRLRYAFSKGEP